MGYLIEAGLLLLTLLFGIMGIRILSAREKANGEMMSRHLAIDWQDVKTSLPAATYGMSIIFLMIAFLCLMALIIAVCVVR